jgi:DNA modification methylase
LSHPAKFTDSILEEAARVLWSHLPAGATILDPFAGTGKGVAFLRERGYRNAMGTDLEPPDSWGDAVDTKLVAQCDALNLGTLFLPESLDAVFTSPTYGNRFADRDMRPSCAGTYAKGLGRNATDGSSCHLQWGNAYREFHAHAWAEVANVLKPGGLFLLNISDHYRAKRVQPVTAWHVSTICALDFEWIDARSIATPRMTRGVNSKRCAVEWLHLFAKR